METYFIISIEIIAFIIIIAFSIKTTYEIIYMWKHTSENRKQARILVNIIYPYKSIWKNPAIIVLGFIDKYMKKHIEE